MALFVSLSPVPPSTIPRRPKLRDDQANSPSVMGKTDTSLDIAFACGCITPEAHRELTGTACEIGSMLWAMINNPAP